VREYTQPGEVTISPTDNVVTALMDRARRQPEAKALAYRKGDTFVDLTVSEVAERVRDVAAGLMASGVEPGDRVALFSKTRLEFTVSDLAILAAGAVTVPIYETSSPAQVQWVVGNSGAKVLIVEDDALQAVAQEVAGALPELQHTFVIDRGGLDQLVHTGQSVEAGEVDARIAGITHDSLATLVYTSGTTGNPKGVMLTHGNFIWDVRQVVSEMPDLFIEGTSTLMFLPLAHIFARVVQMGAVAEGVVIAYSTGVKNLVEELKMYPPTWVFSVPRVFEKIYNTAHGQAGSGLKAHIFDQAVKVAGAYSRELQDKGSASLTTKAQYALFDRLVYGKLRAIFGNKLKFAISGGAPLGQRLGHFYRGIGVMVLEGYGLTETTAAATANTPADLRIGTVGKPIPGTTIRIAEDGEVLIKGGQVMRGYWQNDEATAEVKDPQGFFRTGDVGSLDADGFLTITGRKKELIVTAGGKNVQPAGLEDRMRAHALISQAVVVGDAQPFIAALVTLDPEELPKWAAAKGKQVPVSADPVKILRDDSDLLAEVQSAIDDANATVSKAEAIRAFRILDDDLTIEGGELTPTLKVKRKVVLDKYADVVADIYAKS
jgi:long-chain acyl-CoA synthetase